MSVFLLLLGSGGQLVLHSAVGRVGTLPGVVLEFVVVHAHVLWASSAAAGIAATAATAAAATAASSAAAAPGISATDCVYSAVVTVSTDLAHLPFGQPCCMQVIRQPQIGLEVLVAVVGSDEAAPDVCWHFSLEGIPKMPGISWAPGR